MALLVSCLALVAAACSDDGNTAATVPPSSSTTMAPVTTVAADDGVLRLGLLAPLTGDGAALGLSLQSSVQLAVDLINEAGGVNSHDVEVRFADEGADIAAATAGLDQLVKDGVDAIVGPTSSTVTLSVLDTILREQLLACSPTATAMALDDFPDDGLFFRTVPSDSLEAEAIARSIDLTGRSSVGLMFVDDAYGRPFADRVRQALADRSIAVTATVPFSPTDTTTDTASNVAEVIGSQVIAVIGAADSGSRVVSAIIDATPDSDIPIVVNDAMRGATAGAVFAQYPDATLQRIVGVGPRAVAESPDFLETLRAAAPDASGLFAANAFDCVNLIALAASAVGTSDPREIAGRIPSVASSGSRCLAFADCAAGLSASRNVDYDGPSGALQLAFDGDPNRGVYDVFGFDPGGADRVDGTINVNV